MPTNRPAERASLPGSPVVVPELVEQRVELRDQRSHVDPGSPVGDEGARRVGEEVAPAHFGRVDAQIARDEVHDPFRGEMCLRLPETPVGPDRAGRGGDTRERPAVLGDRVRATQRPHGDERGADPGEVEDGVADVARDADVEREHSPVVVIANRDVVHLGTRVDGSDQRFGAVLAPAHRTSHDARQQRDQALLAQEVLLVAEAATDVGSDHPHVRLREPADLGDHGAELMRLLRRREQREAAPAGVERCLRTVTLERQAHDPVALERLVQHVRGTVEREREAWGRGFQV